MPSDKSWGKVMLTKITHRFMVAISSFFASKLMVSSNERERLLLKISDYITKTQRKQADFKLKKNTDKLNLSGQFVRKLVSC